MASASSSAAIAVRPVVAAQSFPVQSNLRALHIKDPKRFRVYKYDVRVFAELEAGHNASRIDLTPYARGNDFERLNIVAAIAKAVITQYPEFFGDPSKFAFGRQFALYSMRQLNVAPHQSKSFTIGRDQIPNLPFTQHAIIRFAFELAPLPQWTIEENLAEFLSAASSKFTLMPSTPRFISSDDVDFCLNRQRLLNSLSSSISTASLADDGTIPVLGMRKTVRLTRVGPVIATDLIRAPFYNGQRLLLEEYAATLGDPTPLRAPADEKERESVIAALKGLIVATTYQAKFSKRHLVLEVASLDAPANVAMIQIESESGRDGTMSVAEYYQFQYGITLKHPDLPCVVTRQNPTALFPLEVLVIADGQRAAVLAASGRTTLVHPAARLLATAKLLAFADQNEGSATMSAIGVEAGSDLMTISARRLTPPRVVYGDGRTANLRSDHSWRPYPKFVCGARCESWIAVSLLDSDVENSIAEFSALIRHFYTMAIEAGMKLDEPLSLVELDPADVERELETTFKQWESLRLQFVFVISSRNVKAHGILKLCEARFHVVTQEVTVETARLALTDERVTWNILAKTNLKLGGRNCDVLERHRNVVEKEDLIVGIEWSRRALPNTRIPETDRFVTVLGWAANCGTDPTEWSGGYRFIVQGGADEQDRTDEELHCLMCGILEKWTKSRGSSGAGPRRILVYRSRDHWSQRALEFSAVREAKALANASDLVSFVALSRRNAERFYRDSIPPGTSFEANLPPGVAVDRDVVSDRFPEFYLIAHKAEVGTTRTPRYTLVHGDWDLNQLVRLTHALCFTFGITPQPVSVPAVVLVAERFARRGADNFSALFPTLAEQMKRKRQQAGQNSQGLRNLPEQLSRQANDLLTDLEEEGGRYASRRYNA